MPFGANGWHTTPGDYPWPYAAPGPMTDAERFMFETCGFLVVPGALSPAGAARRVVRNPRQSDAT